MNRLARIMYHKMEELRCWNSVNKQYREYFKDENKMKNIKQLRLNHEYPHFDVPNELEYTCKHFVDEVDNLLNIFNLSIYDVRYTQIKYENKKLNICYEFPKLTEKSSQTPSLLYSTINNVITLLKNKAINNSKFLK